MALKSILKKIVKKVLKIEKSSPFPSFVPPTVFVNRGNSIEQLNLTTQYKLLYKADPSEKVLLSQTGFSCYSQHEEDGILLFIFSLIGVENKKCVEICAGTGIECNTANLIIHHKWIGLLCDGNPDNIAIAKEFYKNFPTTQIWPPKIQHAWISLDNVNNLIKDNGFEGEIDLLSLDIDGIDYWLWKGINIINPRVIVLEINHLWGPEKSVSVPYKPDFKAEFTEYGSDYAGASIAAFVKLGKEKGYRLVGTNAFATNAFFIREDIKHDWLPEVSPNSCFDHPRAKFGMEVRLPKVKDKEWVNI